MVLSCDRCHANISANIISDKLSNSVDKFLVIIAFLYITQKH